MAGMAQKVGALSCKPNGFGFNSQLGHIPRLLVWSLIWECMILYPQAHMGGKQLMLLFCIDVSLSPIDVSLSPSLSLSL